MHCSLFPRPATRCDPSRVTPTQHAFQAHSTSNPRHNVFFAIRHSAYRTPSTVDFRSLSEEGIAFVHVTDRRSLCTKFPSTVAFSWHPHEVCNSLSSDDGMPARAQPLLRQIAELCNGCAIWIKRSRMVVGVCALAAACWGAL